MACTHVLEQMNEADPEQFPDLLCKDCIKIMASADVNDFQSRKDHLPAEVHLVCRNCVLSKVAKSSN